MATARAGLRAARNTGPRRPASSRGSRMAAPVCQCTKSVVPSLDSTRARLLGRSRSSASRPRISSARAAVSYSMRHRVLSRSGTSSRHSAAIWSRVSARVASTGTLGRAQLLVGSPAARRLRHQASAERSAARCRARWRGRGRQRRGERLVQGAGAGRGVQPSDVRGGRGGGRDELAGQGGVVCRYFTAVPGDQAPGGAMCADRKASAAWLNAGAGSSGLSRQSCPWHPPGFAAGNAYGSRMPGCADIRDGSRVDL